MGNITLIFLLTVETIFLVWSILKKNNLREEKSIVRISIFALFVLLIFTGVYIWSFRYFTLLIVFTVQAIIGAVILIRKKQQEYKVSRIVFGFIRNCFIILFAIFPVIVFPQYKQPKVTGQYEITTSKYTWTDNSRKEEFSKSDDNRKLTVEFWYPNDANETYPLIIFSHGAFGFSGSNYSTFAELASNGYVVASIGHTYHAFYTKDNEGNVTIVDSEFIDKAIELTNNGDKLSKENVFKTTKEWMELRTGDENFVLNTILDKCKEKDDQVFKLINTEKIGLMGHSLGGATSAQVGRERNDIDAVIVLDGTMLGEEIAFQNDSVVLNDIPYPVPLLNIYAEDHYNESRAQDGDKYNNFYATKNAICAYETVFVDSGHLNFTDLPLFSPTLAKMLGVGKIDSRFCIEKMNEIVLDFFDCYLKDGEALNIEKEYKE